MREGADGKRKCERAAANDGRPGSEDSEEKARMEIILPLALRGRLFCECTYLLITILFLTFPSRCLSIYRTIPWCQITASSFTSFPQQHLTLQYVLSAQFQYNVEKINGFLSCSFKNITDFLPIYLFPAHFSYTACQLNLQSCAASFHYPSTTLNHLIGLSSRFTQNCSFPLLRLNHIFWLSFLLQPSINI